MALTRAMLKGMGLTEEQVGAIIEEHTNVTEALKEQRDKFKEEAESVPALKKSIEDLKKEAESSDSDEWKTKYEKEHEEFENYKKDIAHKENISKVEQAYKKLLTENKVGEKHIASILKVTKFDDLKLDKDGKLVDADKLSEQIKEDWGGFITKSSTNGAEVETPPGSGKKTMSKEEILKIEDTSDRQKAIAENHELFGF